MFLNIFMSVCNTIDTTNLPSHIELIVDGQLTMRSCIITTVNDLSFIIYKVSKHLLSHAKPNTVIVNTESFTAWHYNIVSFDGSIECVDKYS